MTAAITKTETHCTHCGFTFIPPRSNAKYCSPRCKQTAKDQRRKPQRLDRDRLRRGVQPSAYRTTDAASVAAKFSFQRREGYTKRSRPKPPPVMVECVIDLSDDFSDYVPVTHPLPTGGPAEFVF